VNSHDFALSSTPVVNSSGEPLLFNGFRRYPIKPYEGRNLSQMRELAAEVLELQKLWSWKNTPEMQKRGVLIRKQIPQWMNSFESRLRRAIGAHARSFGIEGSDGVGRKAQVPWVRLYSKAHSESAQHGWYCVLLFHAQGAGFYLCLCHGSTEGAELKSRSPEQLQRFIRWAREKLAEQLNGIADLQLSIDLGADKTDLGVSYAHGTVAAKWYPAARLPAGEKLKEDICAFAECLAFLYDQSDLGRLPEGEPPEVEISLRTIEAVSRPLSKRLAKGQGFGLRPEERKVVELHAMKMAREHFVSEGYQVKDLSATESFDLRITQAAHSFQVEVKGTTGLSESIMLTANEVDLHRAAHPHNALFVVSEIQLNRRSKRPVASGGISRIFQPWEIDLSALVPAAFRYRLPKK
jgi:hypothetical protein